MRVANAITCLSRGLHRREGAAESGAACIICSGIPATKPAAVGDPRELRRGVMAISVTWPIGGVRVRGLDARVAAMIRVDAMWLAMEAVDMRAGPGRLLALVVAVFGAAQAHHGYIFANAHGTRLKLLVNDGFGVWCAARRLHQGRFLWTAQTAANGITLTKPQFDALDIGLP